MSIFTSRRTIITLLKHAAQALNDILENDDTAPQNKSSVSAKTPHSVARDQEVTNAES